MNVIIKIKNIIKIKINENFYPKLLAGFNDASVNGAPAKHKVATVRPMRRGADSPPHVFHTAHIIITSANVNKNSTKKP